MTTRLVRRDPTTLDWTDWLGRRLEDWWPEQVGKALVKVEEFRDGDALVVRAEIPGIDPEEDVDISVHDGVLHIHGERTQQSENTQKDQYRSEFTYGMFERTLQLPAGTVEGEIKATYKDGVLEVRVPISTAAQSGTKVPVIRLP